MKHSRRRSKMSIVFILICTLVIIGGSLFFAFNKKPKETVVIKELYGEIMGIEKSRFVIKSESKEYIFSSKKLDVNDRLFLVGNSATIDYIGDLVVDSSKVQRVEIEEIHLVKTIKDPVVEPAPVIVPKDPLDEKIEAMSLQEKVAQMFFVRVPEVSPVELIRDYQFGGYILFGGDFENKTKEEVIENISLYQQNANIPLLIGTDEEGGTVNRASRYFREEPFKSPQELYNEGGYDLLLSDVEEKASFLHSFGIQVNFAPVADVSIDGNDFIYDRSFGKDAFQTATYIKTMVERMNQLKLGSVLKHFPGYGNNTDTHTGVAYDTRPEKQFLEEDFLPFISGIEAGTDAVLVSHNIVECYDQNNPSSLSPKIHTVLRDDLSFDGMIMTDDLAMNGASEFGTSEQIAIKAVQAGNDMLLSSDAIVQSNAIIEAVNNKVIKEEQIDHSVKRILKWKQQLNLIH